MNDDILMHVDFLIHGVLSSGHSSWKNKDKDYCQKSYITSKRPNVVLETEVQNSSTYYNYLRYNNILAAGRPGSYFGITIKIQDNIYTDIKNMYHILDMIFNEKVVGTLLTCSDDKYVFSFNDFQQKNNELIEIENSFGKLFQEYVTLFNKLINIPRDCVQNKSQEEVNLNDVNISDVVNKLQKGYKLCVSAEYETQKERALRKEIEQIKTIAEKNKKELETKIEKKESKIRKLKEECQCLKEENSKKDNYIEEIKSKVPQFLNNIFDLIENKNAKTKKEIKSRIENDDVLNEIEAEKVDEEDFQNSELNDTYENTNNKIEITPPEEDNKVWWKRIMCPCKK